MDGIEVRFFAKNSDDKLQSVKTEGREAEQFELLSLNCSLPILFPIEGKKSQKQKL
jgi:hypothetical protein